MANTRRVNEEATAGGRQIARAATLVMALFVVSKALALGREVVIGATFATTAEYDAYLAAIRVPDLLFNLIAVGAVGSAFIPVFASYFARDDAEGGWRMASAVTNLLVIALTVAAGLAWVTAPLLVRTILAPGWVSDQQALTVSLMRTTLVAPIIFGLSGVVMGILNARQHFFLPALAPSFLNIALIGASWFLAARMGVRALALGYVVGAVLHLVVQLPGLFTVGARYYPLLSLRHPGVRQVLRLMAPRVLGLAAVQLNFLVNVNIASWLGEGAVSALNYAWLLVLLPHGIFAQAVATAAFPTFADQVARGEREELRRTLASTLRVVFFLTVPAAVGMLVLGQPLVALFFERGAFGTASTDAVAWALSFYALGLIGHSGIEILARAFYALHDTWTPVWVGGVAMGLNIALSLALSAAFSWLGLAPHGGLALANSIAAVLEMMWLLYLIRRRLLGIEGQSLLRSTGRSMLATAAMAIALVVWGRAAHGMALWLVGGGGALLGTGIYLASASLLGAEELRTAWRMIVRRRRPTGQSPQ
jgi:putative peptidoglycan lipid II flippase